MTATDATPAGGARGALARAAEALPLLAVATLLLSTGAPILPGDSLVSVGVLELTPSRLLVLAGLVAVLASPGEAGRRTLWRTGLELPLALLLAVSLLATREWDTDARMRFLVEGVALFYLTFAVVRSRADARAALAWIAVIALSLSALVAIAQVSQGEPTGFYRQGCLPVTVAPPVKPPDSLTRAVGTFANPNVLAGHLLLLGPLAALALTGAPLQRGQRLALGLALALAGVALVLTFSRSGVLAAVVALALGALAAGGRRGRTIAAAAAAIGIVAVTLLASCGSDAATASYGRKLEWQQTMAVIGDNPVIGVGLGRLGDVLRARDPRQTAAHAHNLFLTWWAEAGTGALLAWLAIFAVLLWKTLRATRAGDPVARAAFVALIGFALFSLLDHPANVDRVAGAFWIVAGLGAATAAAWRDERGTGARAAPREDAAAVA